MKMDYDIKKSETNIQERGISFEKAINFDWETALCDEDDRKQYHLWQ
jgi:uncharacterized DUF497 family protein